MRLKIKIRWISLNNYLSFGYVFNVELGEVLNCVWAIAD